MRMLAELDHYEVLELSRDAEAEDVERAYRLLRSTFGSDSLATYGVYDEDESQAMLDRIELAFSVLNDAEARAEYDGALASGGASIEDEEDPGLDPFDLTLDLEEVTAAPEALPALDAFEEGLEEEGQPWSGSRLRRNRLQRGIELEEIAGITKVNPTYLRFIEEEHFEGLPAPVYVRGFVTAYARCLGLDATRIVPDYLDRYEAARGDEPPTARFAAGLRRR